MASPDTSRYYTTPRAGIASVGSYQIAGTPFLSSSALADGHILQMFFPAVTRRIIIKNDSTAANTDLILSFDNPVTNPAVAGLGNLAYIKSISGLAAGPNQLDLGIKCNSVFLYSPNAGGNAVNYTVIAELTGIQPGQMFELSGSGINDI